MSKRSFAVGDFIRELENMCTAEDGECVLLSIDNSRTWPHFSISGQRADTPTLNGFFVEGGTSFWQINTSGRETFTGDYPSSALFIEEMREVIHVLARTGCAEIRWRDEQRSLVGSMIKIEILGKVIVFGKAPFFLETALVEELFDFDPYCYRSK